MDQPQRSYSSALTDTPTSSSAAIPVCLAPGALSTLLGPAQVAAFRSPTAAQELPRQDSIALRHSSVGNPLATRILKALRFAQFVKALLPAAGNVGHGVLP